MGRVREQVQGRAFTPIRAAAVVALLASLLLLLAPVARAAPAPGTILAVAGTSTSGYSGDGGPATSAELADPGDVAVDSEGNRIIFDNVYGDGGLSGLIRLQAVSNTNPGYPLSTGCPSSCTTLGVTWRRGDIYTVAGTGAAGYSGDGQPATSAQLSAFSYGGMVIVDHRGNLVFSDGGNAAIRVIAVSSTNPGYPLSTGCPASCTTRGVTWRRGRIYTVAGTGMVAYAGDGRRATSAHLDEPAGLAVDHDGNLVFTDQYSSAMRVIAISSVNPGYHLPATCRTGESSCATPTALRTWTRGHVYTIAGGGTPGFAGDGGPAASALMQSEYQEDVSVDAHGNIVFGDAGDDVVRLVAVSATNPGYPLPSTCRTGETACGASLRTWKRGDIYSIAGLGSSKTYAGDGGPATSAALYLDDGGSARLDAHGNIVIADNLNSVLRVVAMSRYNPGYVLPSSCPAAESSCGGSLDKWTHGDIYSFAGNGTKGYQGDNGRALSAEFSFDWGGGLAFDARGDVIVADTGNNVIREITVRATVPGAPTDLRATPGARRVSLVWRPPVWRGGPSVTGYAVYKAVSPGQENYHAAPACATAGANTTRCTVTGLTNGRTYYFTVKARNVVGLGPRSNQASAKPEP